MDDGSDEIKEVKNNLEFPQRHLFPSTNTFSIDIDPFSTPPDSTFDKLLSNQVSHNPFGDNFLTEITTVKNSKITANPFADPFDIDEFNSATQANSDPFSVFNTVAINNNLIKMSSEEDNTELNFKDIDLPRDESSSKTNEVVNERSIDVDETETAKPSSKKNKYDYDDSSSSSDDDEFKMPPQTSPIKQKSVDIVEIRDSFSETTFDEAKTKAKVVNDSENEDDMDNAFTNFSNEKVTTTVEDLPSLGKEFGDTQLKFDDFDSTESNTDFNDQMSLAMRKGDTHLETVNLSKMKNSINDEEMNESDEVAKEEDDNTKTSPKSSLDEIKLDEDDETTKEKDKSTTLHSSSASNRSGAVTVISKNFNRGVKIKLLNKKF